MPTISSFSSKIWNSGQRLGGLKVIPGDNLLHSKLVKGLAKDGTKQ